MAKDKNDLTQLALEINRALFNRDVESLFGYLAEFMNLTGLKATSADLRKIPTKNSISSKPIRLVKSD